jgi:hypothetical protein
MRKLSTVTNVDDNTGVRNVGIRASEEACVLVQNQYIEELERVKERRKNDN